MKVPVNAFYEGDKISKLELLTVESFLQNNHSFNLFTYNNSIGRYLPGDVNILNASDILDKDRVFVYDGLGDCVEGSISGFSDIFRYYLLYKIGGWYVDMDITCLKNFSEISDDIVIRPHGSMKAVANILKMPKGFEPLGKLIHVTEEQIDKNNDDWVKPLSIFNDFVNLNNLQHHIVGKDFFGDDDYTLLKSLLVADYFVTKEQLPRFAIHWCSTAFKTGNWSKEKYNFDRPVNISTYNVLLRRFGIE